MKLTLNASEVSNIWISYTSNSASICLIQYYLHHVEDQEIKQFLEQSLRNSEKTIEGAKYLFNQHQHPLPYGFTNEDVNVNAPRLYSDVFLLIDIWKLSQYGLVFLSTSLVTSASNEVRKYYTDLININLDLYNRGRELLVKKGIDLTAPVIPAPENVDFAKKDNFFADWFGERRPINVIEIKEIVFNLLGFAHGTALLMGFSQVAKSEIVREFMNRGREICEKHVEVLQSFLKKDELPTLPTFESEVTVAQESPYTDKLMMYLVVSLAQMSFGRYGIAISTIARSDITLDLARLMAEIAKYLKEGINIMVDNSWYELPPRTANRDALIQS